MRWAERGGVEGGADPVEMATRSWADGCEWAGRRRGGPKAGRPVSLLLFGQELFDG